MSAINWIKGILPDEKVLAATVCGALVGVGAVIAAGKIQAPAGARPGSNENSKWNANPKRDYCIRHTNIKEPKPLLMLRQVTSKHERAIMESTHDVGQLLVLLMRMNNAKTVLEVGSFTGVALLKMSLELPENGKAYALDVSSTYCDVGKPFMEMAGVKDKIEYLIGPAVDSLAQLSNRGLNGTIDMVFIDADKGNYPNYLRACLELLSPGGLIVFDNATFGGKVVLPELKEPYNHIDSVNKAAMTLPGATTLLLDIGDGCLVIRKDM